MKNLAHAAFGLYEATDGRNCKDCHVERDRVVLCTFHANAYSLSGMVTALEGLGIRRYGALCFCGPLWSPLGAHTSACVEASAALAKARHV